MTDFEIICGDCLDVMRGMADNSVNIVFTSPPYNKGIAYVTHDDRMDEEAFWQLQEDWVSAAFRVASDGARMYATIGDAMLWNFRAAAERGGWRYHQLLAWCKPNLVGGGGRITGDWNFLLEACLLFHKGKRTPMLSASDTRTHNWLVATATQSNFNGDLKKVHPAQMPIAVAYRWLSRTPGDVVMDPFMGSGTTGVAALQLGRRFIGIEISPEYCEIARKRLSTVQLGMAI